MPVIKYSPRRVEDVLKRLSEGETLTSVLKARGMPARRTWNEWAQHDEKLHDRYLEALKLGADARGDEFLDEISEKGLAKDETSRLKVKWDAVKHLGAIRNPAWRVNKLATERHSTTTTRVVVMSENAFKSVREKMTGEHALALPAEMRDAMESLEDHAPGQRVLPVERVGGAPSVRVHGPGDSDRGAGGNGQDEGDPPEDPLARGELSAQQILDLP